jgi:thermostable 8-oxoguanine DNA glycosylase
LNEFAVFGSNARPKNRKEYLEMEDKFREFSEHIRINVDELDLLLWSMKNGRILK